MLPKHIIQSGAIKNLTNCESVCFCYFASRSGPDWGGTELAIGINGVERDNRIKCCVSVYDNGERGRLIFLICFTLLDFQYISILFFYSKNVKMIY